MLLYPKNTNIKISLGFNVLEVQCPCSSCRSVFINPRLVTAWTKLRNDINFPVKIHSCYRCQLHNSEVGGAPLSRHQVGEALDLNLAQLLEKYETPREVYYKLQECGFTFIQINEQKGYVHCDVRRL